MRVGTLGEDELDERVEVGQLVGAVAEVGLELFPGPTKAGHDDGEESSKGESIGVCAWSYDAATRVGRVSEAWEELSVVDV